MESYKIEWKNSAVKELKQLPKEIIRKIHTAVEELSQNPYHKARRNSSDWKTVSEYASAIIELSTL